MQQVPSILPFKSNAELILAIDPGKAKFGFAIATMTGDLLQKGWELTENLSKKIAQWKRQALFNPILLGKGTTHDHFTAPLSTLGKVLLVEEYGTTLSARSHYWKDHPPHGWRKFIPATFRLPPEPYDDYVALLLIEAYLKTI